MYLWGAHEDVKLLSDEGLSLFNAIQTKVGKSTLGDSSYRWFAQRYNVNNAFIFNGNNGNLNNNNVNNTNRCQAVAILPIFKVLRFYL